jgi:hypothetical protein
LNRPCIIPVAAADALAWAAGRLSDSDLLLHSPLKPEAIFVVNLPCHSAWRECIRLMVHWHAAGCVTLITRTGNPVVARHFARRGMTATLTEADGKKRYMAAPDALAGYLSHFGQGRGKTTR